MGVTMNEPRFSIDWDLKELEEENVKLRKKIEEQKAIISELKNTITRLKELNDL